MYLYVTAKTNSFLALTLALTHTPVPLERVRINSSYVISKATLNNSQFFISSFFVPIPNYITLNCHFGHACNYCVFFPKQWRTYGICRRKDWDREKRSKRINLLKKWHIFCRIFRFLINLIIRGKTDWHHNHCLSKCLCFKKPWIWSIN